MPIRAENALARYQQENALLMQRAIFAETEVGELQEELAQARAELDELRRRATDGAPREDQ
jgi:capsule polysaccharide export protein KpsE/RkpR